MSRDDSNLDPRLASELTAWAQQERMALNPPGGDRISIIVDREKFIATRNALTNAFVGLSGAIDEAVKAYVNHTNAVLDGVGGSTLDISGLLQPFAGIGNLNQVAQLAQQAILQQGTNGVLATPTNPDGTRKKRQYKPRDPNAPKRPLTAYFRYLQEQRPIIQAEIAAQGPSADGTKAGDISKIATERWNDLPKDKQLPYRKGYEREMHKYYADVKQYKAEGGQADEDAEIDEAADPAATPFAQSVVPLLDATVAEEQIGEDDDESSEDDEDDEDDEEDSDDDSESEAEAPARPPPVPVAPATAKPTSPELQKKTLKPAAVKKTKAGADPIAPAQQFSSMDYNKPVIPTPVPSSSEPDRKRKADASADNSDKKKRARKSKAQLAAEDAALAASQLQVTESLPMETASAEQLKKEKKEKKEKKKEKKRKSEAAITA